MASPSPLTQYQPPLSHFAGRNQTGVINAKIRSLKWNPIYVKKEKKFNLKKKLGLLITQYISLIIYEYDPYKPKNRVFSQNFEILTLKEVKICLTQGFVLRGQEAEGLKRGRWGDQRSTWWLPPGRLEVVTCIL